MQSQQNIQFLDVRRLMIGQTPASFLIEVAVRAVATYVLLLVATRLMGKRVAGQMSVMEMTVLITLGAAIGVPLQVPERGLLAAVVILTIAIVYQRGLNLWAFRSRRAELLMQGDVTILIRDGWLDLPEMRRQVLSHERLYSALRQSGVIHLGQVKRAYLEADGHFSIFRDAEPPPGLCLMPEEDVALYESQFLIQDQFACRNCGRVEPKDESNVDAGRRPRACPTCGATNWSPAVQSTEIGSLNPAQSPPRGGPLGQDQDRKLKASGDAQR